MTLTVAAYRDFFLNFFAGCLSNSHTMHYQPCLLSVSERKTQTVHEHLLMVTQINAYNVKNN